MNSVQILDRLIGFPTVSRESNLALIEYVRDFLAERGAADMKGFLACALRAAHRATARPLWLPLQLAFSYDEEVGCLGVRSLIEDMAHWAHRPRFCIVGEPTLLRTAVGH